MRYIQSLVTRTRQTDKIPMALMLDAINHTLGLSYGVEFESVLPTYLCDCNYKNFKTSSFHKQFNPCHHCLIIDLEKTVSRTFRYSNKSDVRVKDPITEKETVYLFFPDEEPKVEINSLDKIQRGFVGEDLEGRALPKELIAEFKKDDDWDDFYSDDDSSWESYDYDSDYDYGTEGTDYQSEIFDNESINTEKDQESIARIEEYTATTNEDPESGNSLASKECDFQILQQIKSKKYILDVDQRITITNVSTIDLDKVPTKEQSVDDLKWLHSLIDFIRCGWTRVNVLRNSGDGDKELAMITTQLRLMCEAYERIFSLKTHFEETSVESYNNYMSEIKDLSLGQEKELMPVLKKMVSLGKDKEAMLAAKNWLPILEEQLSEEEADVMAVLGILEFRRRQDGWAAQHLLESFKLAYEDALSEGESFDLFAYLGDPRVHPSSTPWLLKDNEVLRLSELLADRAPEYLDPKQQWFLYESLRSYVKQLQPSFEDKELKKSVTLVNNLSKKMLMESKSLLKEDKEHFVPKVAQQQYNLAHYYVSKEKWDEAENYLKDARFLLSKYPELEPLNLKVEIIALSIVLDKHYANKTDEKIRELIEASSELYLQNKDLESLEKVVDAYIEQINQDINQIKNLSYRRHKDEDEEDIEDDNDYDDWDEEDEFYFNGDHNDWNDDDQELKDVYQEVFEEDEEDEEDEAWDNEDEEDWAEDEDYYDYDCDVEEKVTELKQEIVKDFIRIQALIDDYKKNSSEDEESDSQPSSEALQKLEIRQDITKLRYLIRESNEENDLKAFELYQDLIRRISEMLDQHHDQSLYETYQDLVRANAMLCFDLEKFNEAKKGYKQLISYQKNLIAGMPQKGRAFQEANLELAQTYSYLGSYYADLKTYDHALKYAQKAQELVDKYADIKVWDDLETKMEVYSFLYTTAKDAGKKDIAEAAEKEYRKLERHVK